MKRNLVIIHMESLNMLNYRINREYFPNLCEIERKSVTFTNYYSSATSTIMVLSDLAYQGSYINEALRSIGWKRYGSVEENSLLDDLYDRGYDVNMLHYPSTQGRNASIDLNDFVGRRQYIKECTDEENYHDEILKVIEGSKPFVLWTCNFVSHMDFNKHVAPDISGIGRWIKGYEYLDEETGYIFGLLRERELLSNTTIILYGDHGDDIYSHGYHGGLTHAVEPYQQLVHTPMFVYDERFEPGTVSAVVSTADIANMARKLFAMPDEHYDLHSFPIMDRKYAFSRNMFAAQRVRGESFGKGYSVMDGQFLLLVNTKGLEMYEIRMDPECQNNLLLFYRLENNKLVLKKEATLWGYHFMHLMDEKSFDEIEQKFYELRDVLLKKVNEIYQSGRCMSRLCEMSFETVQKSAADLEMDEGKEEIWQNHFEVFDKYFEGKRVVLYGAGNYGSFCYDNIKNSCEIVAWVDKKYKEYVGRYDFDITAPETILDRDFDLIYIAITNDKIRQPIFDTLVGWGIDEEMILL